MDMVSTCKKKLAYFRIKELKDVLTQLGISKQGKKQDLLDRILALLPNEAPDMHGLGTTNFTVKQRVAEIIDDTYRKLQGTGATDSSMNGESFSEIHNVNCEEVVGTIYLDKKIRCPCGSSLPTEYMIQCTDPECRVFQHICCVIIPEDCAESIPPIPSQFYCEICRIRRADPFWETVAHPLSPVMLVASDIPVDGTNPLLNVEQTFEVTSIDIALLQNAEYEVQAWCILLNDKVPFRMQWPLFADLTKLDERSLRNPLGVDRDATKRQKLENGYLCKVAHLKHQSLLSHKLPKVRQVDPNTVNSRLKVTVPREPDLETAHRAQKHRSRNNSESGEHAKSKGPTFKARPLNRKILKAPSLLPQIKSRPQSPVFQEFHLKTSKRAMQHSSANDNSESISKNEATHTERPPFLRLNCEEASKQEKCKTLKRVKFLPHNKKIVSSKKDVCTFQNVKEEAKELKLLNDDGLSYNPPIELFNKLSLKSELEHNAISPSKLPLHTKGSKENIPGSLKQVVQRYGRKLSHCGSKWMIPEIGPQPNIYRRRSMNIR